MCATWFPTDRHRPTLKISTFWFQSSRRCSRQTRHVRRVCGSSGKDAAKRQRLASRLLGGLRKKVQSQKGGGGGESNAEEIPTGDCANDATLPAEKRNTFQRAQRMWVPTWSSVTWRYTCTVDVLQQHMNKSYTHTEKTSIQRDRPIKYELAVVAKRLLHANPLRALKVA